MEEENYDGESFGNNINDSDSFNDEEISILTSEEN